MDRLKIHAGQVSRTLIIINVVVAIIYISWWFNSSHVNNAILYYLLFAGEVYHLIMAFTFWSTIWPGKKNEISLQEKNNVYPSVDVYIPVAGEPVDVISKTALAAKNMTYQNHKVYILNDGYVIHSDNWQQVEKMAKDIGVTCITRKTPGGAKAGNINNALKQTSGEIIVIFDADMIPYPEFLQEVIPYFKDEKMGFVQTPQYYINNKLNLVTSSAWQQQELFFGPILQGKDQRQSAFICGTNVAIRRAAIDQVGGMYEKSIAEDFLTSLFIHQKGWKSKYLSNVLSTGLAPQDMLSYYKQQLRWARGSLQVLFGENPLFKRGLSFTQKIQYLSSALYYMNGVVVVIDMITPLLFLLFGIQAVASTTTSFAVYFIPFMFFNMYTLYLASGKRITFNALSFSHASWIIQVQALISVLLNQNMKFSVTPKEAQKGNFTRLAYPHILYFFVTCLASVVGIWRGGFNPSVVTNIAWAVFNIAFFFPFIMAATSSAKYEELKKENKIQQFNVNRSL